MPSFLVYGTTIDFISGIVGLKISPITSWQHFQHHCQLLEPRTIFCSKNYGKIGRKKGFILSSTYSSLASLLGACHLYREFCFVLYFVFCNWHGLLLLISIDLATETVDKDDEQIISMLLATILSTLIGPNVANFKKDIISDHLYTGSYVSCTNYYTSFFVTFL